MKSKRPVVRNRKLLLGLCIFCILLGAGFMIHMKKEDAFAAGAIDMPVPGADTALEPETVVIYLEGLPLVYGEYRLLVPRYRALVLSEISREFGLSEEEGFWEQELPDGSTPGERLNEQVLAQWKKIKAEQKTFIEAGVMEPFDYAEFHAAWEQENERRRQRLEAGEIIYGPAQYEEEAYYFYLQDKYRNEAERKSN